MYPTTLSYEQSFELHEARRMGKWISVLSQASQGTMSMMLAPHFKGCQVYLF